MPMEAWKVVRAGREPQPPASEDKQIEIRSCQIVAGRPWPLREQLLDIGEVVGKLGGCGLLDRSPVFLARGEALGAPEPPEPRMDCARQIGHPPQCLVSRRRSGRGQ